MPYSPSELRLGSAATFPAYTDVSTSNYGDPNYLNAEEPGGYNDVLNELAATQQFITRNINLMGWVNVADYYETADNGYWHNAINRAIDSGRGNIIFLPANYRYKVLPGQIKLPERKYLVGASMNMVGSLGQAQFSTVTMYTDDGGFLGSGNGLIELGQGGGISGIVFGDYMCQGIGIKLYDNFTHFSSPGNPGTNSDGFITNCWFAKTSMKLTKAQGYVISNITFDTPTYHGMELYGCSNNRINNIRVCGSGFGSGIVSPYYGLIMDQDETTGACTSNMINNFHVDTGGCWGGAPNTIGGIKLGKAVNNTFAAMNISHNKSDGLLLSSSASYNTFTGIVFAGNKGNNIKIDGGTNNQFTNIITTNTEWSGSPGDGSSPSILLTGNASKNRIRDINVSSPSRSIGVRLDAGTTKNSVNGVTVNSNITIAVQDAGTSNVVGTDIII